MIGMGVPHGELWSDWTGHIRGLSTKMPSKVFYTQGVAILLRLSWKESALWILGLRDRPDILK